MLTAGGSLERPPASIWRRVWLAIELLILYVAAPVAMISAVHEFRAPLFAALVPVLLVVAAILAADRTFSLFREARTGFGLGTLLSILAIAIIGAGIMAGYVRDTHPEWFLEFPRNRPEVWGRIMLIYPFASVAAQEIVYRTFFFHRYGPLFGSAAPLAVVLNGVLFGFGHIVVGNPFAVLGAIGTGLLFAARYNATRSFWAVFLEHTLWGWMVFTLGLGRYFFTGVSNL